MLKELKTTHRDIARLTIEGIKPAEIAVRLDVALVTVYKILKDPLCKGYMSGLQDKADLIVIDNRKRLSEMTAKALDVFDGILKPDAVTKIPASVQATVAKDVLDRTGFKPVERTEHMHGHFTAADLDLLKKRSNNKSNYNEIEEETITVN